MSRYYKHVCVSLCCGVRVFWISLASDCQPPVLLHCLHSGQWFSNWEGIELLERGGGVWRPEENYEHDLCGENKLNRVL